MMVKALFLDAEGTFLIFNPGLGEIYKSLWKEYGVEIDPERTSQALREAFRKIFKEKLRPPLNGEVCKRGWREVFESVFAEYKEFPFFDEVFQRAYAFFASPECVKVAPYFREFVLKGKERGLKFAVISNWDCRLYSILEGHKLLSLFDAVFLGCEIGYLKPNQKIFLRALSYFKIEPFEAMMIGDSLEDDIYPAENLGLKTYHIKGFPDYQSLSREIEALL